MHPEDFEPKEVYEYIEALKKEIEEIEQGRMDGAQSLQKALDQIPDELSSLKGMIEDLFLLFMEIPSNRIRTIQNTIFQFDIVLKLNRKIENLGETVAELGKHK